MHVGKCHLGTVNEDRSCQTHSSIHFIYQFIPMGTVAYIPGCIRWSGRVHPRQVVSLQYNRANTETDKRMHANIFIEFQFHLICMSLNWARKSDHLNLPDLPF